MVIRHQQHVTSTTFLILAAGVGAMYAFYSTYNTFKPHIPTSIIIPVVENSPTPLPTTPPQQTQQTSSQISPDGTKQLTMTVTTNKDFSKTYSFVTTDADGSNVHQIYSVTYNSDAMSIPFNTWSPDDSFIYITHITPSVDDELVFRANGEPMTATEQYLNLTETFMDKITSNTYDQTTGWASDTLLIILTKKADGTEGTSYWFEVPDKALIPLSTQF